MPTEADGSLSPARVRAVVIGGGLAGIATAVRLAQSHLEVCLVETRRGLGGRATSFVDPGTAAVVDNCQHVLLGCCTNLRDLYERLGVADCIRWHRRLHFVDAAGVHDQLEAARLPAPLHLTRSLLRFRALSLTEKVAIARAMLAMMRLGREGRKNCHDLSFARWLLDHEQPAGAVEKFWAVIVISALNERLDRVAADYAIQVFQDGFLSNREAYLMGVPSVPLVRLYDAAQRTVAAAGGTLLLGTRGEALVGSPQGITGLKVVGGHVLEGDVFVCALPFDRLGQLCPPPLVEADRRLTAGEHFEASPIIGIHLWYDRPVMDQPHLVLTQSPLQWLFDKGADSEVATMTRATTYHLHGVISAAHDLVDLPGKQIVELAQGEIQRVLPAARRARLQHHRVIKEKRATFSARPGIERFRPEARGSIPNLYLAGDWCRSGWPATMEGAVRSGYLAAAAVLEDCGLPAAALAPDLPRGKLCQMVGWLGSG